MSTEVKQEVKQEGEFKIKSKTPKFKDLGKVSNVTKIDLSNLPKEEEPKKEKTDAIQEPSTEESVLRTEQSGVGLQEVGEIHEEPIITSEDAAEKVDTPLQQVEETTEIRPNVSAQPEAVVNTPPPAPELPEGINKLLKFMEDTGGDVQDYARLNADYSNVDNTTLIREYYKQTKPHLDSEDVSLLLEDFSYDAELDEDRDIRKKKLAFKEEVAKAKNFLEDTKSKYYEEIKLRPGITQDQQKATDFFNRYKEDEQANELVRENFIQTTNNYFANDFKGFDFKLGNKSFKYGVKDPSVVADKQKDLSEFVGTFLNENGNIKDPAGYHKAIYAARNADTMASHFYEQGKTDAIKEQIAKSKNITTEARQVPTGEITFGGMKVKAISGVDSSKLKIKNRKFNN
tara:strand:+ start:2367 stop:3569 length:1203 start_codon:yes stop_codon:yes gene_type:complete